MLRKPGRPNITSDIEGQTVTPVLPPHRSRPFPPSDIADHNGQRLHIPPGSHSTARELSENEKAQDYTLPSRIHMVSYSQPLVVMTKPQLLIPTNPFRRSLFLANPNTDTIIYYSLGHSTSFNANAYMIPLLPYKDTVASAYPPNSIFRMESGVVSTDDIYIFTGTACIIIAYEGVDASERGM